MKNVLVLFLAIFTSVSLFANDGNFSILTDKDSKTMVIDLKKNLGGNVVISIVSLDGETVFSEAFKADKKARKYNLSNLKVGTYTLIIEDEEKVSSKKVHISKASLLVDNKIEEMIKPTVISNGDFWVLNVVNLVGANIIITDEDGNKIYSQVVESSSLNKRFNVSKLPSGTYYINYDLNGKTFSNTVSK
jgi:hypothetical protein